MTAPASRRRSAPLAGALFLFVCSCGGSNGVAPTTTAPAPPPAVPAVGPFFEDVTAASGITHTYRCGEEAGHYSILESLGGGAALIDYDGDGLLDAFLPGGGYFDGPNKQEIKGHPCRLYKNLGGLKFKDVSQEAGVGVVTHYTHGAAVGDYDKDGWPDLVVTGWGKLALLRNEADGKGGRRFADVTTKAGLTDDSWSVSAGWADFDGDGHPDLYACHYVNWRFGSDKTHPTNCNYDGKTRDVCPPKSFHPLPHIVYRNNGDGTFADVSKAAGLRMPRAPGDYAPLKAALKAEALASARMGPLTKLRLREEAARRLRKARGLSEFERPAPEAEKEMRAQAEKEVEAMPAEAFAKEVEGDIERSAEDAMARLRQADDPADPAYGKGLGVLLVDVNLDGKPDVYVCNDTVDNFLYVNRSKPGQVLFEEVGLGAGVARDEKGSPNGSMGVDAGDPLGTGRPAIWVTNYENELHALYLNDCRDGKVIFRYGTQLTGIAAIGQAYVGWGTNFLDLDRDGWQDLVMSNGHAIRFPKGAARRAERPVALLNEDAGGRRKFRDVTSQTGPYFAAEHVGRGVAFGDLDNDGRVDMVAAHLNEPAAVLRGVGADDRRWLGVELRRKDRRDPVGSRVVLEAGGKKQHRFAKGGGSYASANDPRHVFGLDKADKADHLTVVWPDGTEQTWESLAAGQYWVLTEGEKEAKAATK